MFRKSLCSTLLIFSLFLTSCGDSGKSINMNISTPGYNQDISNAPTPTIPLNPQVVDEYGEYLAPFYNVHWEESYDIKINDELIAVKIDARTDIARPSVNTVYHTRAFNYSNEVKKSILDSYFPNQTIYSDEQGDKDITNNDGANQTIYSDEQGNKEITNYDGECFWTYAANGSDKISIKFFADSSNNTLYDIIVSGYPISKNAESLDSDEKTAIAKELIDTLHLWPAGTGMFDEVTREDGTKSYQYTAYPENFPVSPYVAISQYNFSFYNNYVDFHICNPCILDEVIEDTPILSLDEIKKVVKYNLSENIDNLRIRDNLISVWNISVWKVELSNMTLSYAGSIIPVWLFYNRYSNGYSQDYASFAINAIDGSFLPIPEMRGIYSSSILYGY